MRNFLDLFRFWEPLDFSWMNKASQDELVFFGCLIAFGVAVAFGV